MSSFLLFLLSAGFLAWASILQLLFPSPESSVWCQLGGLLITFPPLALTQWLILMLGSSPHARPFHLFSPGFILLSVSPLFLSLSRLVFVLQPALSAQRLYYILRGSGDLFQVFCNVHISLFSFTVCHSIHPFPLFPANLEEIIYEGMWYPFPANGVYFRTVNIISPSLDLLLRKIKIVRIAIRGKGRGIIKGISQRA